MKYLIDFVNNTTEEQIQLYLQDNNCTLLQVWSSFDKVVLVEAASIPVKTDIVENVVSDESSFVKPLTTDDVIVPPSRFWCLTDPSLPQIEIKTKDTKDWWKNYSLNEPEFEKDSITISRKGSRVPVYIMDSGIKSDHPEFEGVQISNLFSVIPGDFSDTAGHGTAIASVISGKTCGITSCPLKIVKIFVKGRPTLQSEFLSALDAIITDVPENSFAVVNCSWAIARNPWIEQKMLRLIDRGIFIISSAGNNGGSIEDVTPAAMPEVITIGSYNSDLKPSDFSAYTGESHISYTNSSVNGGEIDGWAPGENIWAANLGNGYGNTCGTSMSAAIVTATLGYFLNDVTNEDGTRMLGYEDTRLTGDPKLDVWTLNWLCLGRPKLLDLSDPKYAKSRGEICTLLDAAASDHTSNRFVSERNFVIRVGEKRPGPRLFYPHETEKIEILEPLPENFFISPMGSIIGNPAEGQGPSKGETHKEYQSKVRVTYLDGMVSDSTINFYVLDPVEDLPELPEDHPIIVGLQSNCFAFSGCYLTGFAIICTDNCFYSNGCCNPAQFKSSSCYCY